MDFRKWVCPPTRLSPNWCLAATAAAAGGSLPQVDTEWVIPAEPERALCPTSTPTSPIPNLGDGYFRRSRCRDLCSSLPQPVLQVR